MDAVIIALAVAVVALAVANALAYAEIKEWRQRALQYYQYYMYYCQPPETEIAFDRVEDAESQESKEECPAACLQAFERYSRGEITQRTLRQYYSRYNCPEHCRKY